MSYRKLLVVSAAAILATAGFAQNSSEDMMRELKELKAQNKVLAAKVGTLEESAARPMQDDALETEINRLSERLAGCTLNSKASMVTMDGEFRIRSEWSLGRPSNSGEDNHDGAWGEERVRLGFKYDFAKDVTAKASLQSTFVWGDNPFTSGLATNVGLYEGWVEMRNVFNRPEFSMTNGRQELVFGNQFQFGNNDWFNGLTFDASRWDWKSESFDITGFWAQLSSSNDFSLNQTTTQFSDHHGDELFGLYFTLKTIKNHKVDLYWVYVNGDGDAGSNSFNSGVNAPTQGASLSAAGTRAYFHTFGARVGGTLDVACGLDWNLEGAYQTGATSFPATTTGFGGDVDEFTVEGEVGLMFNKDNKFRVFTRGLFAEGPHDGETGYLNLYTNRHSNGGFRARYGMFDLIPMSNVFSLQAGAHFDPAANWTIGVTGLWANASERAFAAVGNKRYAWEVDLWAEYRYSDTVTMGGGVALLWAGDQGAAAWGITPDNTQFIGYLQARVAF